MVRENTRVSDPQVLHTFNPQLRVESVTNSARAGRVILGHTKVPDGGLGLFGVREVEFRVFGESALYEFALHGLGVGDFGEHLDAGGEDGSVGWVAEEAGVDFWVV